ncbi:MAG TPA: hypothetical protein DCE41_13705 [Cytophagales bacterium]|nr:hypothetical protein [Cytophagales bacterium]HAP58674.1 hypothetical protein [Cytophagales bacterium]
MKGTWILRVLATLCLLAGLFQETWGQKTGLYLEATHPEYSKTYTYKEGKSIFFSLKLAPEEWQKGVIMEIHEDYLIIADKNKRGLPRLYPLSDINALWPNPRWHQVVTYFSLLNWIGSTTFTLTAARAYRHNPNLENFSRIVLGASGMVIFSIPMFVKDKMPLSSDWNLTILALPADV